MPQPRQTPLEMERSRLRKLERRRELYGDRCSTRASDVERQRNWSNRNFTKCCFHYAYTYF